MNTSGSQSFQSLGPRFTKGDPTFKSNLHWSRRQQPALQWLSEKKPVLIEVRRSAHHNSSRLLRSPLAAALVKQLMVTDQAGALMSPQGSGTDQAGICPGQCLLQGPPVSLTTQLSRPPFRRRQASIKTDGQHQPNRWTLRRGALGHQAVDQTAATASRAAGDISSCGASA